MNTSELPAKDRREQLERWARDRSRKKSAAARVNTVTHDPSREGPQPLSPAQQRLWFLWRVDQESTIYNVPVALRLSGELNVNALQQTFNEIVRRHHVLRTRIVAISGEARQVVVPPMAVNMPVINFDHLGETECLRRVETLAQEEASRPFDLTAAPLLRTRVFRHHKELHTVVVTLHHIVSDGWSLGVLVREVGHLYDRFASGLDANLPPLPVQYVDYAVHQREWLSGGVLEQQLNYWRVTLADVEPLQLPTDRPRSAEQRFHGARHYFRLPPTATKAFKNLLEQEQCTLYMGIACCFNTLLARTTGQNDFCVGTPVANRGRAEIAGLIGFFVNTLVLRARVDLRQSFRQALQQVRTASLSAFEHQDIPFEYLVEMLRPDRNLRHSPLFQVMLAMQNAPMGSLSMAGLSIERLPLAEQHSKFDFAVDVYEDGDEIAGFFEYNTDLFYTDTIDQLSQRFMTLIESVATSPDQALHQLHWCSYSHHERRLDQHLAYKQNTCPSPISVIRRFEAWANAEPTRIAVTMGDIQLSYGDLDERANSLAIALLESHVGVEQIVGVSVERSPLIIVAMLAIWKVGAAYLPLDPSHPSQRIRQMAEDAQVSVVIVTTASTTKHTLDDLPILPWSLTDPAPKDCKPLPPVDAPAAALAYVIYTSGSTGRPKGVLISNESLARHIVATATRFDLGADDLVLQITASSFDPSIEQIACALSGGAAMLMRDDTLWDVDQLVDELIRTKVTIANIPAAYWHALSNARPRLSEAESLRCLIVGGEAIHADVLDRLSTSATMLNAYGPTETTVTATTMLLNDNTLSQRYSKRYLPIGTPLDTVAAYILDDFGTPQPLGVPGQLYLAGSSVARGYLGQAALTAASFIPDPFGEAGTRMYGTGDLARWVDANTIEYLGRVDRQIKLRGFRIEPGEIESALCDNPDIAEAVVLKRETASGTPLLVAYVVPNRLGANASDDEQDHVSQWQKTFDQINQPGTPVADSRFNILGWHDSYEGAPIAAEQMAEWVDQTVERILDLQPRRILEVGCGTGLLAHRLVPHCQRYVGTDLSANVVQGLQQSLNQSAYRNCQVDLHVAAADQLAGLLDEYFDTVVINSVVQYFPSLYYLDALLTQLMSAKRPPKCIFLGDIRHFGLLDSFCASLALAKRTEDTSVSQVRRAMSIIRTQETELLVDPRYFSALTARPNNSYTAAVLPKVSNIANEMTKYRYDVSLELNKLTIPANKVTWRHWRDVPDFLSRIEHELKEQPETLGIRDFPNPLLQQDTQALAALQKADDSSLLTTLDLNLHTSHTPLYSDIQKLASRHGYQCCWSLGLNGNLQRLHVLFCRAPTTVDQPTEEPLGIDWTALSNHPVDQDRKRCLQITAMEQLRQRFPDYMVPAQLVPIDSLPLTTGGKVDRSALPDPDALNNEPSRQIAASTATERTLERIWAEVLGLSKVSVDDDFFALGGHSLLCVKLVHLVSTRLNVTLPLAVVFGSPTIASMAKLIDDGNGSASLLVPLAESSNDAGIYFCIHPIGGEVFQYRLLAQVLGEHATVIGVQSAEAAGLALNFKSLKALARSQAQAITERQTEGPLKLIGWSSGGTFAAYIAEALEEQQRQVAYLGLIDCAPAPTTMDPSIALNIAVVATLNALRGGLIDNTVLQNAQECLASEGRELIDLLEGIADAKLIDLLHTLTGQTLDTTVIERLRKQVKVTRSHIEQIAASNRASPSINVHAYWTEAADSADDSWPCDYPTASNVRVDGDHYSVLAQPAVQRLVLTILQDSQHTPVNDKGAQA